MRNVPGQPMPDSEPDDNVINLATAKRRLRATAADAHSEAILQALREVPNVRAVRPKKPLPLLTPPAVPVRFRLRVDVVGAKPPIWRRLSVPSHLRLDRLHDVLQAAFGWTNCHLHQFTLAGDPYGQETEGILTPFDVEEGDQGVLESELRLDQFLANKGNTLHYTYDFGDDWEHTITVEAVENAEAGRPVDASVRCLAGRRKGPPDDIGGIHNYEHILAVAANPSDPEYRDMVQQIAYFQLFDFTDQIDLDAINRSLDRL